MAGRHPRVKRTGELLVDDHGRKLELFDCGHAGPRSRHESSRQVECIICGGAGAWKLRLLPSWRRDGKQAAAEGRRRWQVVELTRQGVGIPYRLAEPIHERALRPAGTTPGGRSVARVEVIEP